MGNFKASWCSILNGVFIVLILLLLWNGYQQNNNYVSNVDLYERRDSILQERISTITDSLGSEIVTYKHKLLRKDQLLFIVGNDLDSVAFMLEYANRRIADLTQAVTVPSITKDTVKVIIRDTVMIGTDKYLPIVYRDEWASIQGTAHLLVDSTKAIFTLPELSYSIENKVTLAWTTSKKNFLAADQYNLTIRQSNPYTTTGRVTNYTISQPKKWHEKRGVNLAAGFILGAASIFSVR